MYIDRIDLVLPQTDITSILAAYSGAEALLEPLPSVSKSDRKRYAKLGLKNEALALQIIEVGRANPNLIPRGIDFEMIDRDITARAQLKLLKIQLQRMLSRVDDAMLLLGVDVYAAALSMYHCLRRNADTTSLKETVDELRKGFARPSRKKKEEADGTSTPDTSAAPPQPQQGPSVAPLAASSQQKSSGKSVAAGPVENSAPITPLPRPLLMASPVHSLCTSPLPPSFSTFVPSQQLSSYPPLGTLDFHSGMLPQLTCTTFPQR